MLRELSSILHSGTHLSNHLCHSRFSRLNSHWKLSNLHPGKGLSFNGGKHFRNSCVTWFSSYFQGIVIPKAFSEAKEIWTIHIGLFRNISFLLQSILSVIDQFITVKGIYQYMLSTIGLTISHYCPLFPAAALLHAQTRFISPEYVYLIALKTLILVLAGRITWKTFTVF